MHGKVVYGKVLHGKVVYGKVVHGKVKRSPLKRAINPYDFVDNGERDARKAPIGNVIQRTCSGKH
ncbi:hypothetical protein M514_22015 [Trichuris suis]|uniref:Uncharacterized protein n=1 Tax=Trichuris suis TaxID=68888 RepID=A0A085N8K7_9BILA|nr:hypothetical protein M514_22015 [Trichuris suis]